MTFDPAWLHELFAGFGPIRLKRMFSGHGVYAGEHMVAMAMRAGLCLRVDDVTEARFVAIGARPFTYEARGRLVTVRAWWLMPERFLDEPEALSEWVRLSLGVAERLPAKKKRPARLPSAPKRKPARKAGTNDE